MNHRKFSWLSSIDESNKGILTDLNLKLSNFYSRLSSRQKYNKLINSSKNEPLDEVTKSFLTWFEKGNFKKIIEIGCGTGRIRQHLLIKEDVFYTGVEVSEDVISKNKILWPDSEWVCQSAYELNFPLESFDLVYSFYVLEHLVFPYNALEKLYSITKSGGYMVIICPDFIETSRLPSQFIGQSFLRSAKQKLKEKKIIDTIVGLYDSRIRLKNALNKIKLNTGSFIVNTDPICLYLPDDIEIWSDFDAVYMSSKVEIENWATSKKMEVTYPYGKKGIFKEHIFMVLKKL